MSLYYRDSSGKETVIASTGLTTADLADYSTLESNVTSLKSIVPPRYWFVAKGSNNDTTDLYTIIKLGYGSTNNQDNTQCTIFTTSYRGHSGTVIDCATGYWSYTFFNDATRPSAYSTHAYITKCYWNSSTLTLYLFSPANKGWRSLFCHTGGTREVLSVSYTSTAPEGVTFTPFVYKGSWLDKDIT